MRITITPTRGEVLRMRTRTALARTTSELNAAWSVLSMLNGEMAQYQCEHDIDVLEEEAWRLRHALRPRPKRNLP